VVDADRFRHSASGLRLHAAEKLADLHGASEAGGVERALELGEPRAERRREQLDVLRVCSQFAG
jgi:hypothetical protein